MVGETPNVAKLKGKPRDNFLPMELQQEYDRLLTSRIHGVNSAKKVHEILNSKNGERNERNYMTHTTRESP